MAGNGWWTLTASLFIMMISGTIYVFPQYSSTLESPDILNVTVEQVNSIGTAANAGTWVGVLNGLFYDAFGPRPTLLIGSVLISLGYVLIWMAASHIIEVSFVVVCLFAFLFGQGGGFTYVAALNSATFNFKHKDRGKVVGFVVAFFGLSSGVMSQVYVGLLGSNAIHFLLFLGIVPSAVALVAIPFMKVHTRLLDLTGSKRLPMGYAWAIAIAIAIAIVSVVGALHPNLVTPLAIVILAMVGMLVFVPCGTAPTDRVPRNAQMVDENDPLVSGNADVPPGIESPLQRSVRRPEYWLIFVVFFFGIGAGITILDNLAPLLTSRSPVGEDTSTMKSAIVALFSVFNTLGRIGFGYLSDRFQGRVSRTVWLGVAVLLMGLSSLFFAFVPATWMYFGIVFVALAYGGLFCMCPLLVSLFFGMKHFGANFGLQGLAPGLGSVVFATVVSGRLHAIMAAKHGGSCADQLSCYSYTFFITAAGCGLGLIAAVALYFVRRPYERHLAGKGLLSEGRSSTNPF